MVVDDFLSSPIRVFSIAIGRHYDHPRLRILDIFHVPWSQITSLQLHESIPLNDCYQILVQCINVVSVELSSREWKFPGAAIRRAPLSGDTQNIHLI